MTSPQPLTPIQELWLHTLVMNREKLGDMKPHWTKVKIEEHPACIRIVQAFWRDGLLDVRVPYLTNLPHIEQAEMMQRILAEVHFVLCENDEAEYPRNVDEFQPMELVIEQLSTILRCCPTNDSKPDIRWRKMQMLFYRNELPYADLEDRAICKICHGRVATGAGAQVVDGFSHPPGTERYRSDIHNECYRYAKLILVPAAKAQRQAQAMKATAEVDK